MPCLFTPHEVLTLFSSFLTGADSLRNLYDNSVVLFGVNNDNCILDDQGTPYTTFEGIEKSVDTSAAQENYNKDCILNNPDKKNEACG